MRALAVLVLAVACGGRAPAPTGPAPTVNTEIELAEAAERQRRHDVARVHYERAIALAKDPRSVGIARREYGETLATWGELDQARAHLEVATRSIPDDAQAWHDLGIVRHKLGDMQGAVAALERARALVPEDPRPRVALAALRWKLGDKPGASAEYRALLELELPARLRDRVRWALRELAKP